MKTSKKNLSFIGLSSLVLLTSPFATAAEMSNMDHSGMNMSGGMSDMDHSGMDMSGGMSDMDHSGMDMSGDMSGMDHSGMDHRNMDMSGMQGGQPPADARSPDYSNGVPYGQYGKPIMVSQ
ncbi:hypothetical protein [Psychrobacter sp. 4Dc]|uniref:hypothetical protein n=1 Tax=Psychrobacter sp. 4Dc TaxID=888437 RepID=UPI001D0D0366|nr:hypothetical protein [Psychrobacter sp. 4Dc]